MCGKRKHFFASGALFQVIKNGLQTECSPPQTTFSWWGLPTATITSSSENEERSASSEVLSKDEGLGCSTGVMGRASEDCPPGLIRDNLSSQPDEALPRTDITEHRTPPAPKRPLPQHNIWSSSSLMAPRPNSVAGMFTFCARRHCVFL